MGSTIFIFHDSAKGNSIVVDLIVLNNECS
jgi:hypothetical protein